MTMVSGTKEKAPRIYQSAHFLQVDMDVVELLHGDWKAACLLGMILDMQQQSPDGWVYHSWPQWEDHHFSRAEVERCAALLAPLGLEIQLRDHIGRQTRHYHIDVAKLKAALTPTQQERKEKNEAHATAKSIHPVEKLQGATKLHDAENLQGTCEKVTGHPVEKLQGLLGSDLITKSRETDQPDSDANASGDVADANAPSPAASPDVSAVTGIDGPEWSGDGGDPFQAPSAKGRSSRRAAPAARASPGAPGRKGRSKEPTRAEKDPDGLIEFRKMCFRLQREQVKTFQADRLAGTAKRIFNLGYTMEQVEGCWRETIRDPRYGPSNPLNFDILTNGSVNKIDGYIQDPDGYRASVDASVEKQAYIDGRKNSNAGNKSAGNQNRQPAITQSKSTREDVF